MIPIMFSVMCSVAQLGPTLWTLWTIARQAPLSMDSSRQESQSGLPFPSQDNMLDSFKIELKSEVVGNLLKCCYGNDAQPGLFCLSMRQTQPAGEKKVWFGCQVTPYKRL